MRAPLLGKLLGRARSTRWPYLMGGSTMVIGLLCVLATLTYSSFGRLTQANRWNVHSYRVLNRIAALQTGLEEQESNWRGLALGDARSAAAMERSRRRDSLSLRQLLFLTRDNTRQQRDLKRFASSYARWQRAFRTTDAAQVRAQTGARGAMLDRLKSELRVVQATESMLQSSRSAQQDAFWAQMSHFLLSIGLCTLLGSAASVLLLGSQTRRLEQFNAQLQGSEQQLRTVLDNAPVVLYAIDCNEKVSLITGQGVATMGIDPAWALGRSMREVLGTGYNYGPLEAALRGQASVTQSLFDDLVFETHRLPLCDEGGQITGMIGVGLDITERHHAQNALRRSEERYRSVIESVREVVFQLDARGRVTLLNPAWRLLLGHEIESSLGRPFGRFVHPDDRANARQSWRALSSGRAQLQRALVRFSTRDGRVRWMDVQVQAQRTENGDFAGAAGTINDVTERRIAQEELLAATSLQRAILDGVSYAIIATRPDGVIESFNHAAQQMLGYSASEVCGQMRPDQFHDPAEIEARARQLWPDRDPQTLSMADFVVPNAQGRIEEREWTFVRRDGSRVPVRLSLAALRGAEGEAAGYVALAYDLSESRRTEKLKNEFVSVVSHELRTPLTSIRGALGLLAGGVAGQLPPGAAQMIAIAQKNSDRLVLLINDILDIEKIESGKMRFDFRALTLREVLHNALESHRAYSQNLGVSLHWEEAPQERELVNGAHIYGDEGRLQQVLSNLLSNACKFTPSGGRVHLSARVEETLKQVEVRVRDEGAGVASEFVPRLFEKFAQADSSSTRAQGGTGLGLAIARAIVEKHGGSLDYVAPPPGQTGATFAFRLPLWTPVETASETGRVPSILVCEDDEDVAGQLSLLIAQSGYATEIAGTLEEARLKVASKDYAGVTLDLTFPDGDGRELIAELRAAPRTRDWPVVVVSAQSDAGTLHGEAFGVRGWLQKPVDETRLRSLLNGLSGRRARLLHVEDDSDVRRILAAILGDDVEIVAAASLRQAREQLDACAFDLAILDVGLPDGSGLDLVTQLSACEPPVPVILFSAREADEGEAREVAAALVKSRTENQALRETIRRCLNAQPARAL